MKGKLATFMQHCLCSFSFFVIEKSDRENREAHKKIILYKSNTFFSVLAVVSARLNKRKC